MALCGMTVLVLVLFCLVQHVSSFVLVPLHLYRQDLTLVSSSSQDKDTSSSPLHDCQVAVVGAGPSGLLVAHALKQEGASVQLLESRSDPRQTDKASGRAYALGLGIRARTAIRSISPSLWEAVKRRGYECERFQLVLPNGISISLRDGSKATTGGSVEPSVLLYQSDLCAALLEELVQQHKVDVQFDQSIVGCNLEQKTLTTQDGTKLGPFDIILGCDGVNSVVRRAMEESCPAFSSQRTALPGEFKVCKLNQAPPQIDPTSVLLLLPKSGSTTAFVEPTINGTSCILFAGRGNDSVLLNSTNVTQVANAIAEGFPKLATSNVEDDHNDYDGTVLQMAEQLVSQTASQASSVQCNVYHYGSAAALCGDAAHATGGVSGQGVNSALVDAAVLSSCLADSFDPSNDKEASIAKALLTYSQRQVPEGKALYDLSFGPKPQGVFKKIKFALTTARDTLLKGKWGIGQPPLQTRLTTDLTSFADLRRERDEYYDEPFPSQSDFNRSVAEIYTSFAA